MNSAATGQFELLLIGATICARGFCGTTFGLAPGSYPLPYRALLRSLCGPSSSGRSAYCLIPKLQISAELLSGELVG